MKWRGLVLPHVTANGIELFYEEEGSGQPVLFLHGGFGGVESTLFPKPAAISGVLPPQSFRTISFDRRNSGRSRYDTRATSLEDLANDARGLLAVLGVERAIVVGDSLGGMIALRFALDHAEATSGLVLMETSAHILRRTLRVRAALLAMRLFGPRALFRVFRERFREPRWAKPIGPEPSGEEARRLREQNRAFLDALREMPEDELYRYSLGLIRTYVAFSGRDLRGELPDLQMPVEVIHGTADSIVGIHHGRELARLIPGAGIAELDGLGHGLLYFARGRDALRAAITSMAGVANDAQAVASD